MNRTLVYCLSAAAALADLPAQATDIEFRFEDTSLAGILYGLRDNTTSTPTGLSITSPSAGFGLFGHTMTISNSYSAPTYQGITLKDGLVTAAHSRLDFTDENGRKYTMFLNTDDPARPSPNKFFFPEKFDDVNLGRGGSVIATVHYKPLQSAVPEPATWALMILGLGVAGYSIRKRKVCLNGAQLA
jgi:hypothetical protein